ncbi:hypothetical protein [Microbulbifer epialgicus]|uniref:Uncharacterized protein n=1 Tax=Microbulbifer epialgicus TaxID=393907 RepID=A0ABV4NUN2_9GAMM
MITLKVEAKALSNELHFLDKDVAGTYSVSVPDDIDGQSLANVALDIFHTSISVKCLEDFSFQVSDLDGNRIQCHDGDGGYSYSGEGTVIPDR